jgi:transposase
MDDGSKGTQRMTVGVDLGDRYSYLCFLDTESGEVLEESRVRTTPEAFERRFGSERHLHIAIEVGTHSPWVSRLLEECSHEVLVANARKTRLIYGDKHKNDKLDAENLARLARLDPELLYPLRHRGEDSQAHLAIIRSREALVGSRMQLINHVRGAVKSFGHRLPRCSARSFHKKVAEDLPKELMPALGPLLETMASAACSSRSGRAGRVGSATASLPPRYRASRLRSWKRSAGASRHASSGKSTSAPSRT